MINTSSELPLKGIKVVELATVVAAPTASRILCAYGADVIKVEAPGGDTLRSVGLQQFMPVEDYNNPLFTLHNSGKKLVSIDLKQAAGKEIFEKLLETADVLITNIRKPSLIRLGLDYETLKLRFPKLIYAGFTGFGQKGDYANIPAYDVTAFWMRSGAVIDWQKNDSFPFTPAYGFGDVATSSLFLSGILMALLARSRTGVGVEVTTSLFASGLWCNSGAILRSQFNQDAVGRDQLRPSNPFSNYYLCKDGNWLGVCGTDYVKNKEKTAKLLGLEDVFNDPRYASCETLKESGALSESVQHCREVFATKDSEEWRKLLVSNDVACEVVKHTKDVVNDRQALANDYFENVQFADGSNITMTSPPISFSGYGCRNYEPVGPVGLDTDEVLQELGYKSDAIAQLKQAGTVR